MTEPLEVERKCFRTRLPELLNSAEGRYVLIRGDDVCGLFSTESEAIAAGYERWGVVPFFVRRIERTDPKVVFGSCSTEL